jgi:hypothetical protein
VQSAENKILQWYGHRESENTGKQNKTAHQMEVLE